MADWDVNPALVEQVLTSTAVKASGIGPLVDGSAGVDGLSQVAADVASGAQSPLIGSALNGFFSQHDPAVAQMVNRVQGAINGCAQAVRAILAGDEQIAAEIQTQVGQASASGDFSALLAGS